MAAFREAPAPRMWLLPLLSVVTTDALAAGFQIKTMRAPFAAVEVERPLVLGKGWLEFSLGYDHKLADGAWSAEGEAVQWESARWLYTTERIGIRYGITRDGELYWDVPFHYVNLQNDALGTNTSAFGLGEPRFGWRLQLYRRQVPTTSLVMDLQYKMPAGAESPGSYVGGPNTVSTFAMSSGQADLAGYLRFKQQVGPLAGTFSAGYVHRFSGVSQFVIDTETYQFSGRFKPGSEVRAEAEVLAQVVGPLAFYGDATVRRWFEGAVGTTSGGFYADANLDPIPGSDGWSLDAGGGVIVNVTRGVDIGASVSVPLRGEDLAYFPLEDISATRGNTYSATLELRY